MIFPRLSHFLARFRAPHPGRISGKLLELAWKNGYAWGFTEASLCWLAALVILVILVLALRYRR